jgi:hypothetical protein
MSDRCPASSETISSIAKDLEQPKPITDGLQNLFVNESLGVIPKTQRQDCLRAIASQNASDQVAHTKELMAYLGATPNQTAHDGQILAQRITAADLLPTVQISLGFEDKLMTHRPNLNPGENSPNGVWDTPFSEHKSPDGKLVLQFGDHKVPLE